jgi:hypothetical protein
MPKDRPYVVVDFGSRCSPRQRLTHRDLLRQHKCHIIGVDLKPGRNVDVVMKQPYRLPLRRNGADVIISGQAFEHIPFFWVSFLELARIRRHHDYRQVGHSMSYWGDTVGVFRKPPGRRSIAMMAACGTLRWWANRIGNLDEAAPVGAQRQASPAVLSASTLP